MVGAKKAPEGMGHDQAHKPNQPGRLTIPPTMAEHATRPATQNGHIDAKRLGSLLTETEVHPAALPPQVRAPKRNVHAEQKRARRRQFDEPDEPPKHRAARCGIALAEGDE